jgi:hypothetical protein
MKWRMIGPFRAGRHRPAPLAFPGQPNVFYIGVNNGGVWKTNDYGHTWKPIFDDHPTGSIGALAIAPSNPETIYVGSGEGLQRPDLSNRRRHVQIRLTVARRGDISDCAMHNRSERYSSIRGIRISSTSQLSDIPYGANEERGVFRSSDGGETWQKVLYKDENTGRSRSPSIRRTRKSFMLTCGPRARDHGRTARGKVPAAALQNY